MSLAEAKKPIRSSVGTPAAPVEEAIPVGRAAKPAAKDFFFRRFAYRNYYALCPA